MGQQLSRDIQSRLVDRTLEELLSDDMYVEELERHLPGLCKRSHNNLTKLLVSWDGTPRKDGSLGLELNLPPYSGNPLPKDRNSRTSKLGPLWSIKPEDIGISKSIADTLKQNDHKVLRQSFKSSLNLSSLADHYEYTCIVETRRTLDRILWRFLTTFYFDLISELDATKQRLTTARDGGIAFVVAVICQSRKYSPDIVQEKVVGWTKVGRRYRGFMDALCSGCLILLPEKTSDLIWEQYVPIKGDTFDKVIQFLRSLGIVEKCKKEGWNDLSDTVLGTFRETFRSLITFQFQAGRQPQIIPAVTQLTKNGLIKFKSTGGNLRGFYVTCLCAGRSLLKDNPYVYEVLPLVDSDRATYLITTALACSYYKEYLDRGSEEQEKVKQMEIQALIQAMPLLQQNSPDATKMLMIHHAIINPEMHQQHWTDYLYQLHDSTQQASLVVAAHAIWLMAILPLTDKYHFQTYDYDWIGCGENNFLTKVHGIVGTSRKMVYFQHLIRTAAKFPGMVDHDDLLRQIAESQQWVGVTEERMPTRIALKTAETYKLATQLYALVRLHRLIPSHPYVKQICYMFTRALCELPTSGDEYSGLHPAWCFLVACADDSAEYERMYEILEYIGGVNKSNVSSLTWLVSLIWEWKNGRILSAGWWEEMAEYLDLKMGGNLICVT